MNQNRKPIFDAVFNLLKTAADFKTAQRRFKDITDFNPSTDFPALIVRTSARAPGEEYTRQGLGLPPATTLNLDVFLYCNSGQDPNAVPEDELNDLLDALDAKLVPDDLTQNRLTLGGLVQNCWIEGEIVKVPGDLEGSGFAVVPLKILVP